MTVDCPTVQPGPEWTCHHGGWLPPSHPAAPAPQKPAPTYPSIAEPTEDEYLPDSTGELRLIRTVNRDLWFKEGRLYRHPYGYVVKVDGLAYTCLSERCDLYQRLRVVQSPGFPYVGHIFYAQLFAPKFMWEEVLELDLREELND